MADREERPFRHRGLGRRALAPPTAPYGEDGQSTLEFLLVAMAFSALCCGLAAMWHAAGEGRLLAQATRWASHTTASGLVAALKDITGY